MGTIRSCVLLYEPLQFNHFYILLIFEQNYFDIKMFSILADSSLSLSLSVISLAVLHRNFDHVTPRVTRQ